MLQRFCSEWQLEAERPFVLAPVRIFHVKGVDVTIRWFSYLKEAVSKQARRAPYLLVFGAVGQEPAYGQHCRELALSLGLESDIVWLDGVPVSPLVRDGRLVPSEAELLTMARATRGVWPLHRR